MKKINRQVAKRAIERQKVDIEEKSNPRWKARGIKRHIKPESNDPVRMVKDVVVQGDCHTRSVEIQSRIKLE